MSSLDSYPMGGEAAPLTREVWRELRVKAQPESWLPPYELHNTNYYFKFVHDPSTSSFCLIVTDLCFVWLRRVDAKDVDADMKRFNPSIRRKNTNHTITMLTSLLRENNAQQFHLVRLDAPGESEDDGASPSSPTLHLESSMSLGGLISFKWTFHLHSYGTPLEQCAYLRAQMYLPLHEIIKQLSHQLIEEKKRNERLQASLSGSSRSPHMPAAAAAPPAAGARGDMSLSCDFPSLSTAEREAQAHRLAAGGAAATAAAVSFEEFDKNFTFGQVGPLYVSALNRLSGEQDGSLGLGPSQPSWDPIPHSLPPPDPDVEMERKRPSAADRRRGVKRDRSPSPVPSARHSAAASSSAIAAAAAAASSAERDLDIDYKHNEDSFLPPPSASYPPASHHLDAGGSSSFQASLQSSLDIGGKVGEDGLYHETEAETKRKEMLARQLSAQKKKKKKRAFV